MAASAHKAKPAHRGKPVLQAIPVLQAPMELMASRDQLDRPGGKGRLVARDPRVYKALLGQLG